LKVKTNNGIELTLASTPFKKGGEGSIYKIVSPSTYQSSCVKIYKNFDNPNPRMTSEIRKYEEKIKFIINNQPSHISSTKYSLAWCKELVYDSRGIFLGFVMPIIFPNENSITLNLLTQIDLHPRIRNDVNWEKFKNTNPNYFSNRLQLCANLARAIHTIHSIGNYVLIDFKPENIIITNKGNVAICDIDSMQISNNGVVIHHAQALTDEYSPPECKNFRKGASSHEVSWDNFGIAIVFYQLLFGTNPFSNASFKPPYHDKSLPSNKIENGLFVFGEKAKTHLIKPDPLHLNFNNLPKGLQELFQTALDKGCFNPRLRPSAEKWGIELTISANYLAEHKPQVKQPLPKAPITASKPYVTPSPTYTSPYQKPITPVKPKDDDNSTFWIWFFIIIAVIIGAILYFKYGNSSSAETNSSTNTNVTESNTSQKANPFGAGNGKLFFYKTCNYCPDLQVSIDGNYVGTISQTLSESSKPTSDTYGTISKIVSTGSHQISAKDSYGRTWNYNAIAYEGESTPQVLSNPNDVKPNPFGTGNGKISFYKTCTYCPDLEVSIDGNYVGTISQTLSESSTPSCDDYGTISKILTTGSHQLTAKDSYGSSWNFQVNATDGECTTQKLYKTNDVKPNPYGAGNGKVYVYKTCNYCPDLQISIDGIYLGTLSQTFSSSSRPSCDAYGTVSKVLAAGNHNLSGKDSYGTTWNFPFTIYEGECLPQPLKLNDDVKPNPYGGNNGKTSIWTSVGERFEIYLNNSYQGTLTQYFTSGNPNCGQDGTLSLVLPAGQYTFSAKSNRNTWTGNLTIYKGECNLFKANGN